MPSHAILLRYLDTSAPHPYNFLADSLTPLWHKQGYSVESHPEAIHKAIVGVPVARYLRVMAVFNRAGSGCQNDVFCFSITGPTISTSSWKSSGDSLTKFL